MPTIGKIDQFVEDLAEAKHNLKTNTLKLILSNTAIPATALTKAEISEIAAGNGYTAGGYTLTGVTAEQVSGTLTLTADDVTVQASGGAMAAWRYWAVYNDTAVGDPLICRADRGASITLAAGESETIDLTSGSLLTVA